MATENLPFEQRAEIARTFKRDEEMEELLSRIEKDKTILSSLNSTHRVAIGLYQRSKSITEEFNKRKR